MTTTTKPKLTKIEKTRAEIVKVRANIARLEKLLAETLHAEKDFRARGLMK